jgi:hypothetical protein
MKAREYFTQSRKAAKADAKKIEKSFFCAFAPLREKSSARISDLLTRFCPNQAQFTLLSQSRFDVA